VSYFVPRLQEFTSGRLEDDTSELAEQLVEEIATEYVKNNDLSIEELQLWHKLVNKITAYKLRKQIISV
jgi:hypothetical protein